MKILLILLLSLQGCVLVPFFTAYNEAGLTPETRKGKFPKQVRLFNNNLGMSGSAGLIAQFIAPESRRSIIPRLCHPDKKIVDAKVTYVEFNEEATEADVDLTFKGYQVPYYVVKETVEHTKWKYDGEWLLYEMDSN